MWKKLESLVRGFDRIFMAVAFAEANCPDYAREILTDRPEEGYAPREYTGQNE